MQNFTINYELGYNLWDSKNGWLNKKEGKNPSLGAHTANPKFDGSNKTVQIDLFSWEKEAVEASLITKWNDNNTITLSLEMGNWYNWSSMSIYNHAAVLKIKFDNMNNPGSTTNKFNNNTYLQSGTLNIEEGSSLTINLQSLFDDAKKLFKAAKTNNYLSWRIINSGLIMAGFNSGIIENIQWFSSL